MLLGYVFFDFCQCLRLQGSILELLIPLFVDPFVTLFFG